MDEWWAEEAGLYGVARVPQCLLSGHVQEEKQASVRGGEAPSLRKRLRGHCAHNVAVLLGSMGGLFVKEPQHSQAVDGAGMPWSHSQVVKGEATGQARASPRPEAIWKDGRGRSRWPDPGKFTAASRPFSFLLCAASATFTSWGTCGF